MKEFETMANELTVHGPLQADLYYKINGSSLNELYDYAVSQYNQEPSAYDQQLPFTYSQAFWNGYAKAVDGVRGLALDNK